MAPRPCAVLGIGQTKYRRRRDDVTLDGLVREAALGALEDAGPVSTTSTPSSSARPPTPSKG